MLYLVLGILALEFIDREFQIWKIENRKMVGRRVWNIISWAFEFGSLTLGNCRFGNLLWRSLFTVDELNTILFFGEHVTWEFHMGKNVQEILPLVILFGISTNKMDIWLGNVGLGV